MSTIMSSKRVAVVTGGNKGLGFAIVRGLCKDFSGDVYLTARDEGRGQAAVAELNKERLHPTFHQLDIGDQLSIDKMRTFLHETYGGLDVLVNNAGTAYKMDSTAPFEEQAEESCKINYWGVLNTCNTLFPLLRPHARVVHMSSRSGTHALSRCSESLKAELINLKTIDDVSQKMAQFVQQVKDGTFKQNGWPQTAYGVSKIGVTAMTPVQQVELDKTRPGEDIIVNSCCPGWVNTDMTSHKGTKSIDEGAVTPLYLALLPEGTTSPRGEFVAEKSILKWRK